jgi:hypothetical protein
MDSISSKLSATFAMKDLGELKYFLGMEFIRSKDSLWVLQQKYAKDMLLKFQFLDCLPISTPLEQNCHLHASEGELLPDPLLYRQMVGSLIYLTITRPDLCYSVGLVSQFMQTPRKPHMDAVKRIMRYVKSTLSFGLQYKADVDLNLHGYTDANWAGSPTDRRSTSGYAFSLGSAAISWSSKKQPTVALSSTESEYRGATNATCEAIWLRSLLSDLGLPTSTATSIFADNISSIKLASNHVFHARTKHIEVHYHFVREKVLVGVIDLLYIATAQQVADIFTKALPLDTFARLRSNLGVRDISLSSQLDLPP